MASATERQCIATDWLEEDNLMLLECWARDGYTYQDIANRIGIDISTLKVWRAKYPEIEKALKTGREIIDYKVENALLKSALGYRTKETKVTTVIKNGRVIETKTETTEREQAPNVSAAQCWLYNRLPKKWRNMNSQRTLLDEMDEDTSIHVTVTRASTASKQNLETDDADEDWQDEVNSSIAIRKATPAEREEAEKAKKQKKQTKTSNEATKVELDDEEDLDYWPDDWEDEDEDWED